MYWYTYVCVYEFVKNFTEKKEEEQNSTFGSVCADVRFVGVRNVHHRVSYTDRDFHFKYFTMYLCFCKKKSESFIFLFISVEMECGRRHGGRWFWWYEGFIFFSFCEDGKNFFWDVWNSYSEMLYLFGCIHICFARKLHIYGYARVICIRENIGKKERKSKDPMRGKFDFSPWALLYGRKIIFLLWCTIFYINFYTKWFGEKIYFFS